MGMKLKPLLYGLATWIPGVYTLRGKGTGGTVCARYCYGVWLRHLVMARRHGLDTHPRVVAELGPGDSLGIGLAALVSGAERYLALDVVDYATVARNLAIFDELVALFRAREPIPGHQEWPRVVPRLPDYCFPDAILDEARLSRALQPERLARIRQSIAGVGQADSPVSYKVPWNDAGVIEPATVDMVYSQAVLEHVDDLAGTYRALRTWLRPGGFMSHAIDFTSHSTATAWNGHWACADLHWRLIRGGRPYLLNRQPHSVHLRLLADLGFTVVCDEPVTSPSRLPRARLAPRFADLTDADLVTSEAFIQAVRTDQDAGQARSCTWETAAPADVPSGRGGGS